MATDTTGSKFTIVAPQKILPANIISHNIPENDAPAWVQGTYNAGDKVVYNNRVYEALSTTTDVPSDGSTSTPATWLDLGPTNRFRMFDGLPAPQSVRADIIDFTINTGTVINSVGLINVRGNAVTVQIITAEEGVIYNKTIGLQDTSLITNWSAYFFEPATFISDSVFLDLPNYAGNIRVIVNAGGGTAALGEIVAGRQQVFGLTLFGTTVGIRDYSRIELNNFGDYDITRRRYSKTADYDIKIESGSTAAIQRALGRIRARATLFIGSINLEETILYGLAQDADIIISSPAWNDASISVVSLPYEELEDVFIGGSVNTPTLVNPTFGNIHPENAVFRTTEFTTSPADEDVHESTTWQFSETSDFATIFFQSALDTVNLIEYKAPVNTFVLGNTYWVRALHKGTTFGDSAWSTAVRFEASTAVSIDTPSILVPTQGALLPVGSNIESSAFSSNAAASDTHSATRWIISTNSGMTSPVYDEIDTVNLVTLKAPSVLTIGTTYYATVQYQDIYGIWSNTSTVRQFEQTGPIGQKVFTNSGNTTWVVPADVFSVSAVAVGSGGQTSESSSNKYGGKGGALSYSSSFAVTPGETLVISVGVLGNPSRIRRGSTNLIFAGGGGVTTVDNHTIATESSGTERTGGGSGGLGGVIGSLGVVGGGGAGGYTGNGGDAGGLLVGGDSGLSGAGGGGGGGASFNSSVGFTPGLGGGVGIYGAGSSGAGGFFGSPDGGQGSISIGPVPTPSSAYGGGSLIRDDGSASPPPGQGAVRIIWGQGRSYPSTRTADE